MGSLLAPVLANIIITELESTIVKKLLDTIKIKFYCCYVNDTLPSIKPEEIQLVQNLFNSFDKNPRFTVNRFKNEVARLLDIKMKLEKELENYLDL